MMRAPRDAFRHAIEVWEGGFQNHPNDVGNYVGKPFASPRAGTNRGITPKTWATYKNLNPHAVTETDIRAITLDDAVNVYDAFYYRGAGFHRLPWGPAIEVAADIGWGSGQGVAVKATQRLCATIADGRIGPQTEAAYSAWLGSVGHSTAVVAFHKWRDEFYRGCVSRLPSNAVFLNGWLNRSGYYVPENVKWWPLWGALPALDAPVLLAEPTPEAPHVPIDTPQPWLAEMVDKLGGEVIDAVMDDSMRAVMRYMPILGPAMTLAAEAVERFLKRRAA